MIYRSVNPIVSDSSRRRGAVVSCHTMATLAWRQSLAQVVSMTKVCWISSSLKKQEKTGSSAIHYALAGRPALVFVQSHTVVAIAINMSRGTWNLKGGRRPFKLSVEDHERVLEGVRRWDARNI